MRCPSLQRPRGAPGNSSYIRLKNPEQEIEGAEECRSLVTVAAACERRSALTERRYEFCLSVRLHPQPKALRPYSSATSPPTICAGRRPARSFAGAFCGYWAAALSRSSRSGGKPQEYFLTIN